MMWGWPNMMGGFYGGGMGWIGMILGLIFFYTDNKLPEKDFLSEN